MKYRINRKTGDRISEIGIGSSYMFGAGMAEAIRALRCAVEGGINYFDLAAGDGKTFPIYGEALHDVRKDIFFQIHAPWKNSCVSFGQIILTMALFIARMKSPIGKPIWKTAYTIIFYS